MAANIRIIIDTNWFVSATISKKSRRELYKLLSGSNIVVIICDEIIDEYRQVMLRDKFKNIIKPNQIARFVNLIISKLKM